jgi:hypothetical protein
VAFCTTQGLFKPLVMYFSLTDSPATFQTIINKILRRGLRVATWTV